jgi:hypothetical protein
MFYIKEFYKILKDNIVLSFIFLVSFSIFFSVSHNKNLVDKELSLNGKMKISPYFNALVSNDINLESVLRKMKYLPGVKMVSLNKNPTIKKEIEELKNKFGASVVQSLSTLNYRKLKIELEKGIHAKNQNLIREYLTKLVGKNSLTMGSVKNPRKIKLDKSDSLLKILNWGGMYIIFISGIMFLISSILLSKQMNDISYLIEKFQRKKSVKLKIFMSGIVSLIAFIFIINMQINTNLNMYSFIAIVSTLLISYLVTTTSKLNFRA